MYFSYVFVACDTLLLRGCMVCCVVAQLASAVRVRIIIAICRWIFIFLFDVLYYSIYKFNVCFDFLQAFTYL